MEHSTGPEEKLASESATARGRMQDRVCIVTGAAQGIGAVYASALAREGARVVISDVQEGSAVARTICMQGGEALFVQADVSDEASVEALVRTVAERYGRIDVLVANAAIYATLALRPFTEITVAEWDRIMAVNVRGTFLCAKAVVPHMRRNHWGRIVNIASATVFKGTPNLLHYVSSKGAIVALTRALAREVGDDGICVNTLAPGLVLSEGVMRNADLSDRLGGSVLAARAIRREQMPEDLVGPLLFLASEDSRFTTGQVIVVDGGVVMH